MKLFEEVEKDVMELPKDKQWLLWEKLDSSLNPPLAMTDDEAAAEARRRSEEMKVDPSCRMSFGELKERMGWATNR